MKVSVIIPVFNRTSPLKDAIESIFCQSYLDYEIIVVDDGSKQDVQKSLTPYLDRIIYLKNEKNMGVSFSRNLGIKHSNGEFIAFLDSDDLWLNFKLSLQIKEMEKRNLMVCHTDEFWFKKDRFINQGEKHKRYGGFILNKILDICRISPSSVLIHKSVFEKAGLFDESMRACEDYELWLRIALYYEILYLDVKTTVKRSITNDQLSLNTPFMEQMRLNALIRFYDNFYKNIPEYSKIEVEKEIKRKQKITKKPTKE